MGSLRMDIGCASRPTSPPGRDGKAWAIHTGGAVRMHILTAPVTPETAQEAARVVQDAEAGPGPRGPACGASSTSWIPAPASVWQRRGCWPPGTVELAAQAAERKGDQARAGWLRQARGKLAAAGGDRAPLELVPSARPGSH
jgi:hypothetical protein